MWLIAWKASAIKILCCEAREAVNKRDIIVYLKIEQKMVMSLNDFLKKMNSRCVGALTILFGSLFAQWAKVQ